MTIEKIKWDDYLEAFFNQPEEKEKWEMFCSLDSAYSGLLYPQPNKLLQIYKKDSSDVYFIELAHFYFPTTSFFFLYTLLYKKQMVIFGSTEERSRDHILDIKIIPKALEEDVSTIKTLIKEFLPVLDAEYNTSAFSLVD